MKHLFTTIGISCSLSLLGQVGVNTTTPSSTLEINGSLETPYRKVTADATLTDKDYYVAYDGTAQAVFTLPPASPVSGPTSFSGRAYKVKNLSIYPITIQAAAGQNLKFGGGNADGSSFILNGGEFISLIANDTGNSWNLDFIGSPRPPVNSWKLNNTVLGSIVNISQSIPASGQVPVNGGQLVVSVPPGYSQVMVIIRWDIWGDVNVTGTAYGSLRFHISQTGTVSNNIPSIMMSSWSKSIAGNPPYVRFSAPVAYTISDLASGTYTFNLLMNREGENLSFGSLVNGLQMWGVQGKAEIYVK